MRGTPKDAYPITKSFGNVLWSVIVVKQILHSGQCCRTEHKVHLRDGILRKKDFIIGHNIDSPRLTTNYNSFRQNNDGKLGVS